MCIDLFKESAKKCINLYVNKKDLSRIFKIRVVVYDIKRELTYSIESMSIC